ncbi:peptidase S41 [Myxococcus sp. AM011]|uniref:S41 family peptidase n=1 Tax=Myxococcus sp. AM011 TaxID=2745200 RepID=UPI001595D7A3|nr:S41 family peptidase [Myxococcus sp. AM011]NVJ22254.1 peptidase S41 [Myxococcus sp. AM011]
MTSGSLRWASLLCLGALLLTGVANAQGSTTPEALRAERRMRLVKVWGDVRFRHPRAFSIPAEWDAAFLSALPKVEAARDAESYAAAVQGMLATLGDGATRVEPETPPTVSSKPPTLRALKSWEKDVLVLDLRNLLGPQGYASLQELEGTLDVDAAKARAVVLDLRMRGLQRYGVSWMVARLLPHFIDGELSVPGLRALRHDGLRPQDDMQSFYRSEFKVPTAEVVTGTPGKKPALLVFLVDGDSAIDLSILALRARGKALLVAEGPLDDGAMNTQDSLPLGEGYRVLLSLDEPVLPLEPDVSRPVRARLEGPDEGMRQALLLASRPPKPKALAALSRPTAAWRPEPSYQDSLYPSRELRLLAGAKLWTVVRFFFAYPELMDRPWESRLPVLLEKLDAAKDATAYVLALAEATTWLQDAHTRVRGHPELQRFYGVIPPVWVTDVDGKAVVVKVRDAASAQGLAPGDIIEKVDGEPIDARARRFAPYVAASLPGYHRDMTLLLALGGAEGSTAVLSVRGAQGPKEAKLIRTPRAKLPPPTGASFRVMEGNIGFVDLGTLEVEQVPQMFEALKDTRGIVFDLRDYPRGTLWALGPYFDVKGSRPYAVYERPYVGGPQHVGWVKSVDALAEKGTPKYRGRTVTLIDSRAISQSEHTGLMLEAAADTVFVGSATAGTNGDVTQAVLPGGVTFYFTGQQVRHGDGRQLQRKGLEPHVLLRPTVAGLQAGRDELLERAVQLLSKEPAQKNAASNR